MKMNIRIPYPICCQRVYIIPEYDSITIHTWVDVTKTTASV